MEDSFLEEDYEDRQSGSYTREVEEPKPPRRRRRLRRRGDDIPPISDYAHWNEAVWYAENKYDMEHADEIIEDEDEYYEDEDEG